MGVGGYERVVRLFDAGAQGCRERRGIFSGKPPLRLCVKKRIQLQVIRTHPAPTAVVKSAPLQPYYSCP